MADHEQTGKQIDNQMARNEAKRTVISQARVSIWAVSAAGIIALVVVTLYLTR